MGNRSQMTAAVGLSAEEERERPGQADDVPVLVGLVVERLGLGVAGDGLVNLLAGHPFPDVGVVGDALERDVRHRAVHEPPVQVALRGRRRVDLLP